MANAAPDPDTLSLAAGCTYTFGAADISGFWFGPEAMVISSDVTIEGNGATIARSSEDGVPAFRLFFVGADPLNPKTLGYTTPNAGRLVLRALTLSGGLAQGGSSATGGGGAGLGGAIFNQGAVTLDAVTLTGNNAVGGASTGGTGAQGGGGVGEPAPTGAGSGGGGFGGPSDPPGAAGGLPAASGTRGGGGAGFATADVGGSGDVGPGVGGGGPATGLGGSGEGDAGAEVAGGNGSGGGGNAAAAAGAGGGFGAGGAGDGGGGGVGGGGGLNAGGGFGGGGGAGGGDGGFGGGGGADGSGAELQGSGGFGGGNGGVASGGGGAGLGGAIFNMQGSLSAVNTTFSGNAATGGESAADTTEGMPHGLGRGGAIFNLNGSVALSFSTLAGNEAPQGGRALYDLAYDQQAARSASADLSSDILSSFDFGALDLRVDEPPTVAGGGANQGVATVTLTGASIVRSSAAFGGGQIVGPIMTADPQLGTLAANGGPVNTLLPASSSPALDEGGTSCPATDARGIGRPQDAACDLGAVELVRPPVPPVVTNPQGAVPTPQPTLPKPPKVKKVLPRPIGLSVTPKRDRKLPLRFKVSGRLRVPSGVKLAPACKGRMTVKLERGAKTVIAKKPRLRLRAGRCVYSTKLALRTRKRIGERTKRLAVTARFPGNALLKPRSAKRISVRVL